MPPLVSATLFAAALMLPLPQQPSGQPAQPPAGATLPAVDLAALPPEAAKAVGTAYADAKRRPGDAAAAGHLAVVLHAWEQWEDAAAAYRAAQRLAPRDHRWWHLAGLMETRRGRHQDALALFERAARLAPDDRAVGLRLAEAALESGDPERSAALFAGLTGDPRTAPAAQYGLGRIAMDRGDHVRALEHFDRAVELYPEFGAAHYGRALAYRRLGRDAEAAEALKRQQACLPCWPATGDALADQVAAAREDAGAVLKRGIALARAGQDEAAIDAHERALALDPSLGQARVNLITLYGRTGNVTRAEEEYRTALARGTNLAEAHANFGQVLLASRRAAEAVPVFRSALALVPADAQTWDGLGLALEMTGDLPGASAAYEQAVAHAPAFRGARFNYARTLVAAGRLNEAIVQLEKLRTPEDSETPRYLFALSAALVRSGRIEQGKAEARGALELARQYGQQELASVIERDLRGLK